MPLLDFLHSAACSQPESVITLIVMRLGGRAFIRENEREVRYHANGSMIEHVRIRDQYGQMQGG